MAILTEMCQYLNNWFDRNQGHWYGTFKIENGEIVSFEPKYVWTWRDEPFTLKENQYFRIIDSTFNDGVHVYPAVDLVDEEFAGSVWAMAVPPAVIALADEIEEWNEKYLSVDSQAMSPYNSESFGGYSYSKGSGGIGSKSTNGGAEVTWQSAFASRLNQWRKI